MKTIKVTKANKVIYLGQDDNNRWYVSDTADGTQSSTTYYDTDQVRRILTSNTQISKIEAKMTQEQQDFWGSEYYELTSDEKIKNYVN